MTGQDYDALETFALVVEHGSFTAAALARDVSQPAVSMQVRQLEERLGFRLVERIGRRAHPTAAGREMLEHVGRMRRNAVELRAAMMPYRAGAVGRVRIGTGATACIYVLPPILRRIRERMPGLEIVVETGNSADILRRVDDNDLDLGLVTLPASRSSLEIVPVLADDLVAIFSAGQIAVGDHATPARLAAGPLALYEPGGQTRSLIAAWFAADGVSARPAMQLGSIEAIKKLVAAGICCSIIPRMALDARASREVVAVELSPPLRRSLGLALRRDKRLERGLREVVQALRALSPRCGGSDDPDPPLSTSS